MWWLKSVRGTPDLNLICVHYFCSDLSTNMGRDQREDVTNRTADLHQAGMGYKIISKKLGEKETAAGAVNQSLIVTWFKIKLNNSFSPKQGYYYTLGRTLHLYQPTSGFNNSPFHASHNYILASYLQFKVPLPSVNTVGFLCSENAKPLSWHVTQVGLSSWRPEKHRRRKQQGKLMSITQC